MGFNFSSRPNRRFITRMSVSGAVMVLSATAAKYLIGQGTVSGLLIWVLALIPSLALMGIFYAYGMLIIEQKDEFIRMLILRQVIFGTGASLSLAAAWSFLEKFNLIGHINPLFFIVAFFGGVSLGAVFNRVTSGAWGEMS